MTETLTLTEKQSRLLADAVASGHYPTRGEALDAALRLLNRDRHLPRFPADQDELIAMLKEGDADVKAGRVLGGRDVLRELREELNPNGG